MLPLFEEHGLPNDFPSGASLPGGANAGLCFERFCSGFDAQWQFPESDTAATIEAGEGKAGWLRKFAGNCGDQAQLAMHAGATHRLVSALNGKCKHYRTHGSFATGLGQEHAVENGFLWHYTQGVPYLPGTAVKGIIRAWMTAVVGEDESSATLREWFGFAEQTSSGTGSDGAAGDFIFFDALPVEKPALALEVMTPHYGQWYRDGAESPPADWYNPVPVPFLAVAQATFLFPVAPRVPGAVEKLKAVFDALTEALDWLGAGAKTAAGFGRLCRDKKADVALRQRIADDEEAAKKAMQLKALTPFGRKVAALRDKLEADRAVNRKLSQQAVFQELAVLAEMVADGSQQDRDTLADFAKAAFEFYGWGRRDTRRRRKALVRSLRGEVEDSGETS